MDKYKYTKRFGAPFPRPKRLAIYDESIADGTTGVIHAKTKAIYRTRITDWDAFKAAERQAQSFLIGVFDEAWYYELCEPVTFYTWVTKRQMIEHLQGICVGNHSIDILELQDKVRYMALVLACITPVVPSAINSSYIARRFGRGNGAPNRLVYLYLSIMRPMRLCFPPSLSNWMGYILFASSSTTRCRSASVGCLSTILNASRRTSNIVWKSSAISMVRTVSPYGGRSRYHLSCWTVAGAAIVAQYVL